MSLFPSKPLRPALVAVSFLSLAATAVAAPRPADLRVAQALVPAPPVPAPPARRADRNAPPPSHSARAHTPVPPSPPQPRTTAQPRAPAPPAAAAPNAPAPSPLPAGAPPFSVSGGVYSSDPGLRMAIINGQVYSQGADVGGGIVIEEIRRDAVVVSYRGERYTAYY